MIITMMLRVAAVDFLQTRPFARSRINADKCVQLADRR